MLIDVLKLLSMATIGQPIITSSFIWSEKTGDMRPNVFIDIELFLAANIPFQMRNNMGNDMIPYHTLPVNIAIIIHFQI